MVNQVIKVKVIRTFVFTYDRYFVFPKTLMTLNDLDLNDLNDPASSAKSRSSMKTKAGLK